MTTQSNYNHELCAAIEQLPASGQQTAISVMAGKLSLDFGVLRDANVSRLNTTWHPLNDWSPSDWAVCVAGEMGGVCHQLKYLRRAQDKLPSAQVAAERKAIIDALGNELADTVIYLDLLAARMGINLASAVIEKFNDVSIKAGSEVRL
jgi:hypothetical protein